jgi:hypothetical protein
MIKTLRICAFLIVTVVLVPSVKAQSPADAIMMSKSQLCLAALYTHDTWDEYWEGTLKRDNGNIGTLTRQSVTPTIAYGITDRFNILAALPWMSTEPSGGQMKGVSGIQDFSLWLKATALQTTLGPGLLSIHAVVGGSIPGSDYLEDYSPFSLGLGCPEFSIRATPQYLLDMGLYFRGTAAYNVRANATIERDYYYTTHGVYSDKVDMPDAMSYGITLGSWFFNNSLQVEATYDGLNTLDGFDIRRQEAGFPSNEMDFTRAGIFAHYYFNFIPGFGIIGQYNQVLTGRNVGQSTAWTLGLNYVFGFGSKQGEMPEPTN